MSCGLETQSINFSDFEKVVFKQVRQKDSFFVAGGLCSKKSHFFSLSFFMSWFVYIHILRRKSFLVKAILKHFQSLHENHYELR